MSASWQISLGYDSRTESGWQRLRAIAAPDDFDRLWLYERAISDGAPAQDEDGEELWAYIEIMHVEIVRAKARCEPRDNTFRFIDEDKEPRERYISMSAVGGGASRRMKECLRRAYCLRILERANAIGLNININVV